MLMYKVLLGALDLIKTEYCSKWKVLNHWKLAKHLWCVCERESTHNIIMKERKTARGERERWE